LLLLHTADWHLGRVTYNHPRRLDHERVLQEIVEIARVHRPDLIVHAGDLFDAVRPSYEEIALALDALRELAAVAPTVVLCGNHDSPALFRIFQRLLGAESRLRFVDRARPPQAGGILDFPVGRQRLRLAPLPFVHQNRLIEAFEDPAQRTVAYADRIGVIESALREGLLDGYDPARDVLLFAAHLHVTGARFSGSERQLHVSEVYATRVEHLPVVSYAAFGHIHRPQPLPGTTPGRYAGSPLQLDFGEVGEEKQVVLVELAPGEPARQQPVALRAGRPLRRFDGTLEQLAAAAPAIGEELCLLNVDVESPVPDLSDRIAALLPRAVVLHLEERVANRRLQAAEEVDASAEEPTLVEHFRQYLETSGARASSAEGVLLRFRTLLDALQAEEEARFPEEEVLLGEVVPELRPAGAAGPDAPPPPPRARAAGGDDGGRGAPRMEDR
jgi:exonuclease SbcD